MIKIEGQINVKYHGSSTKPKQLRSKTIPSRRKTNGKSFGKRKSKRSTVDDLW